MASKLVWITSFNLLYLSIVVTSTILLYNRLYANINENEALSSIDIAFIAIYWMPALITCLVSLIAIVQLNVKEPFTACNVISFWIALSFGCEILHTDSYFSCCNWLNYTRGYFSFLLIMHSIDLLIILTIIPIFSCLLPLSAIGIAFAQPIDLREYLGFTIQSITIFLNISLHLFCLQQYGLYSFIIVLCGIFYALSGCANIVEMTSGYTYLMLWTALEILALITVSTIAFVVQYDDERLYIVSIVGCIIYLFPNVPFSKVFLANYYQKNFKSNAIFNYLTEYRAHMRLTDKYYYLLHSLQLQPSEQTIYNSDITETSVLLQAASNQFIKYNSIQCFKMQHKFMQSDDKEKEKIINEMNNGFKRFIMENICFYVYAFSTIIAYLYPIFWFFYVWIYLEMISDSSAIVKYNEVDVQYAFVWIISALYCMFALFWLVIILRRVCCEWKDIMHRKKAIFFVKNIKRPCNGNFHKFIVQSE